VSRRWSPRLAITLIAPKYELRAVNETWRSNASRCKRTTGCPMVYLESRTLDNSSRFNSKDPSRSEEAEMLPSLDATFPFAFSNARDHLYPKHPHHHHHHHTVTRSDAVIGKRRLTKCQDCNETPTKKGPRRCTAGTRRGTPPETPASPRRSLR